jgi:enoyl-CoA hydratase/carnithine racemase
MTGDTYLPTAKCWSPMFREILPADQVLPTSLKLAHRLAKENSPVSMALNKMLVWRTPDSPEATHLLDSKCIRATSASKDAKEGVESFLQKRPAKFPGKLGELDWMGFYPWWTQIDIAGKKIRGPLASSKL